MEVTRPKQCKEQPFQKDKKKQMDQFWMQEMAVFGSKFGANQQREPNQWHVRPKISPDGRFLAFGLMVFSGNAWMIQDP